MIRSFTDLQAAALAACPDLASLPCRLFGEGWEAAALLFREDTVVRLSFDAGSAEAFRREATVLALVRPAVTLPVPDLSLVDGPPVCTRHRLIPGTPLVTAGYSTLLEHARDRLAADLALLHAEIHALPRSALEAAGATPVPPWDPATIRARALPHLAPDARAWAEAVIDRADRLPPDPLGEVWGHFDAHGWNMAFDAERERLNGILDFGDSGFGPLHRDLVYCALVSPDLMHRTARTYGGLTGRHPDPERLDLLVDLHRLFDLALDADDPERRAFKITQVDDRRRSCA